MRNQGRILRVRLGHNPNSSSIGTVVIVFLWSLFTASLVLNTVAAALAAARERREAGRG
ncbi:MAG: hypothetical protein HY722_14735 [Planctomycetes bacterium]|nr:hypothetical protein [Planctomycetota bacterium]